MLKTNRRRTARNRWDMGRTAASLGILAMVALFAILLPLTLGSKGKKAESPTRPTVLLDNPYGPEDFQMDGEYLACTAGESVLGIDVSKHQGQIDWEQVQGAGVRFAMIRVGYRGWESGEITLDDRARENYAGAKAAGLKVGAYFFSQAISVEEAREEAAFALFVVEDWELDFPLVFDWEFISDDARTGSMERQLLTDCALAFCQTVEEGGREPMLYFNPDMDVNRIHLEALAGYPLWLAMYESDMDYPHRVDMWQYTNKGSVPGITGDVDIDLYLPYA